MDTEFPSLLSSLQWVVSLRFSRAFGVLRPPGFPEIYPPSQPVPWFQEVREDLIWDLFEEYLGMEVPLVPGCVRPVV